MDIAIFKQDQPLGLVLDYPNGFVKGYLENKDNLTGIVALFHGTEIKGIKSGLFVAEFERTEQGRVLDTDKIQWFDYPFPDQPAQPCTFEDIVAIIPLLPIIVDRSFKDFSIDGMYFNTMSATDEYWNRRTIINGYRSIYNYDVTVPIEYLTYAKHRLVIIAALGNEDNVPLEIGLRAGTKHVLSFPLTLSVLSKDNTIINSDDGGTSVYDLNKIKFAYPGRIIREIASIEYRTVDRFLNQGA